MCQCQFYAEPVIVISYNGSDKFNKIPVDIDEIYKTEGGPKNIVEHIIGLPGFDLSGIEFRLGGNLELFIGAFCQVCGAIWNIGGYYYWKLPENNLKAHLIDLNHEYGTEVTDNDELYHYIKLRIAVMIMLCVKAIMVHLGQDEIGSFFEMEEEYYEEIDGNGNVGVLPNSEITSSENDESGLDKNNPYYYLRN